MTLENLVKFLANTGKTKLAIEIVDHFSEHSKDLNDYIELSKAYFSIHEYDKAIDACEKTLSMTFDYNVKNEIFNNMARIYLFANMNEEALKLLNILPPTPDVLVMKNDILKAMEHKKEVSATGCWSLNLAEIHIFCEELAEWISNYLDKNKTIHDFGCGIGSYLKHLNNKGFVDLTGYEGEVPNKEYSNICYCDLSHL